MNAFEIIAVVGVGYGIGSIPFAVLIARYHGIDILKKGSGNPGATNIKRVIGKGAGNLCFILDALKGFLSAGWPLLPFLGASHPIGLGILGLLSAILGHSFSVFLKFRGGKGVATTMGGLLAMMPGVLLLSLIVWLIVFYSFRYVSLASICFGLSLPLLTVLFGKTGEAVALSVFIALLILVRHRSNIKRLLAGTEQSFAKKG